MVNMYVIISLLVYVVILLYITYRSAKKESASDFVCANNSLSAFQTGASQYIGTIDGSGLVLLILLASSFAFGLYWFQVGFAICSLILILQSNQIKKLSKKYNLLTVNDLIENTVGNKTSNVVSIAIVIVSLLGVAALLNVSGSLLAAMFHISNVYGIIFVGILVGSYIYFGGYSTIVKTDIFQFLAVIILLGSVLFFGKFPGVEVLSTFFMGGSIKDMLGFALLALIMMYGIPDVWQRLFTSKSVGTTRSGLAMVPVFGSIIYFLIIVLSVTLFSKFTNLDPSNIVFALVDGTISPIFGSILAVVMVALIMSTLDSRAYNFLSTITSNWFKVDKQNESSKYRRIVKRLTIALFTISILIGTFITNFLDFVINLYSFLGIIGPVIGVSLYTKKSNIIDYGMLISIFIGTFTYLFMFFGGYFTSFIMNTVPVFVTLIFCLFFYLLSKYGVKQK